MRENFLEEAFLLQYHLKMNYGDIRKMPLPYRRWFLERLTKEFKSQAESRKKSNDESRGLVDIPMGDMFQQSTDSQTRSPAPQPPSRGRTLKF